MHIPHFRRFNVNELLRADETIEDLQLNGLKLIQKKTAFRFGMDSVILADFADIRENDIVADFGTGNGILILLLHGRKKGKKFYALDIQEEAAELTERNMRLNHLEETATVFHTDAAEAVCEVFPDIVKGDNDGYPGRRGCGHGIRNSI